MKGSFIAIRDRKVKQRSDAIAAARQALPVATSNEEQYLSASAKTICKKIQAKEWKVIDVVAAYCRQALLENERLNFITECFIVEALAQARQYDTYQTSTGKTYGKLHGLPVSVKDLFDIKGVDTSCGMSSRCEKPASKDATIVTILKDAGAIIMYKTNVPQTLMTNESGNPIFGTTKCPANLAYTCGGSSGGEAAAIVSNSAALGMGSDIAGSLRYPIHFSGGYSLKPSEGRFPRLGSFEVDMTLESPCINAVTGPMTRNFEDLQMISELIVDAEPWKLDATCLTIPWNKDAGKKKYHFAYYADNTYTLPCPACVRAIDMTVAALRKAGHQCTAIVPPKMAETASCFVALTSLDGNASMRHLVKNDPLERNVMLTLSFPRFPLWIRSTIAFLVKLIYKDSLYPALFKILGRKTVPELCRYTAQRRDLKQYWLDHVWSHGYDAIICPVYPVPSVKHDQTAEILPVAVTTYLYNLLDYTVGTMSVTKVEASDDHQSKPEYSGWKGIFHNLIYNGMFGKPAIYNARDMTGLNIAVQVVGKQFEEEKVVDMMAQIDSALHTEGAKKHV